MKLTFRVLWFDDSVDFLDSFDFELLEEEIEGWGFEPSFIKVTSAEDFLSHHPYKDFDLIVVDRNLEAHGQGQEFITKVRNNAVFTEVIFYTAGETSALWQDIRNHELEGVYIATRQQIGSKITTVGYQAVHKVLDLENMRGIVMAEVGELDLLLAEIIVLGIQGIDQAQQAKVYKKFYDNSTKQNGENLAKLDAFQAAPDVETMLNLCDSNKRWQTFNRIRKAHPLLRQQASISKYSEEILHPRNFLAHGKPIPKKGGGYRFSYHGRSFDFDEDVSLTLRRKIMIYKNRLQAIKESMEAR